MLGRSQNAYYQLGDPSVSRNHCQVLREGDRVTVIDNGSRPARWSTARRSPAAS